MERLEPPLKLNTICNEKKILFSSVCGEKVLPNEIPKHLRMFSCLKLIAVLASRKKSSMAPEFKVETLGALIATSCTESSESSYFKIPLKTTTKKFYLWKIQCTKRLPTFKNFSKLSRCQEKLDFNLTSCDRIATFQVVVKRIGHQGDCGRCSCCIFRVSWGHWK